MVYNSEEVKDPSFVILEDDILKKIVFKKSDGSPLVVPLADVTDVEEIKSALSGTYAPVADLTAESTARALADSTRSANDQTTDYTLVLADAGKVIRLNSATAKTVTVPPDSSVAFPIGTFVEINQVGAGTVTPAAGLGVTVYNNVPTPSQSSSLILRKSGTNTWDTYMGWVRDGTWVSGQKDSDVLGVPTFKAGWIVDDGDFGDSRSVVGRTRDALPTTPVFVLGPGGTDKIMAFDVCPSGTPGVAAEQAWVDICDVDVHDLADPPMNTCRLGARSDYMEIGSRVFNGGTIKPLHFTLAGDAYMKFTDSPDLVEITTGTKIVGRTVDQVTSIVKAVASQTADWAQFQNSSGVVLTKITSTGALVSFQSQTDFITDRLDNKAYFVSTTAGHGWVLVNRVAANVLLGIKAVASQTADLVQCQNSSASPLFAVTAAGLPRWTAAANVQTTVGAAGGASALPATPSKYLKAVGDDGTTYVIPAYLAA